MANIVPSADHLQTIRAARPETEAHRRQIAAVLADCPGARSSGFWNEHGALCDREGIVRWRSTFLPDAFRFNAETTEIEIYEVEVRSPLTSAKIAVLGEFWEDWDGEGDSDWTPVLILVDRFGNRSRMDLMHAAYGTGWAG